jgi:putative two-component system response regulator
VLTALTREGYTGATAVAPSGALAACRDTAPDVIVLDLDGGDLDGPSVLEQLLPFTRAGTHVPVLGLAGEAVDAELRERAFTLGAKDVLVKPAGEREVLLRVRALLETRYLQLRLRGDNQLLEQLVSERSRDLEDAHVEALERLALAAEYRDDDTLEHIQRVGRTAALVARGLGLPDETVGLVRRAAPLYDIGKIGLSDGILLKSAKLTPEEFEIMKTHVLIGHKMLSGSRSSLLQLAAELALTHHERWDGSGYMAGLAGETIPLSGRIVALADVFDALTHERPYEPAWSVEDAVAEIERWSGRHFDPRVVDVFSTLDHQALLSGPRAPG